MKSSAGGQHRSGVRCHCRSSLLEQGFWYEDVRTAFVDEMRERERADDAIRSLPRPKPGMAGILGTLFGIVLFAGGLALGIPSHTTAGRTTSRR